MLRLPTPYANASYQTLLDGLLAAGYQLPTQWQSATHLFNILSLLDCLKR